MDPPLPPQPQIPSIPNPNPNPVPPAADLPTTISLINDLAAIAESTIKSVSHLLSPSSPTGFLRCPFDRRHLMPPESLFRHSLLCPSAPGARLVDLGFLDTLRYPTSIKSESQLQQENRSFPPIADSDPDLCFSLDAHLGSNFFYRDCPGVVTTPEPDASTRTFTLPNFLSAECANFPSGRASGEGETGSIRILPSELWGLRREVEMWMDYPPSYSYTVLRAASSLPGDEDDCLKKWVISNSLCYGIVIDAAMRDHIHLLLKLCLKAIGREARRSLELLLANDGFFNPRSLSFVCPRLVGSLTWLASQFSVLYGEPNGKSFAIGMVKESLLRIGSCSMLLQLDKVTKDSQGVNNMGAGVSAELRESPKLRFDGNSESEKHSEGSSSAQVFVSQVAAAVAALHERFLLEEKIKAMRFSQLPSKYQLLSDYAYASTRACEEREKRPDYRALVEHDGLRWQRGHNQNQGKTKTREELLAEERDYKRRRMSYRGKKVKRTPKEVIRDIIEEHMEEIKHSGGIGCDLKIVTDTAQLECDSHGVNAVNHELHACSFETPERRSNSSSYKKPHDTEYAIRSSKYEDVSRDRSRMGHDWHNSHQKLRNEHSGHWDDHRTKKDTEKSYGSGSSLSYRSYSQSRERHAFHKDNGNAQARKDKHERTDTRSKDRISRSSLISVSAKEEHTYTSSDTKSKYSSRTSYDRRSDSVISNAFEDRYDPSGSYDGHASAFDDVSIGSNFLRSDNLSSDSDAKYHDKLQRRDSTKGRRRSHHKH